MLIEPGTKLGPYEIEAPLGTGVMAEQYKASDTRLNRAVAIKVLPPGLSEDPEMKERLVREARTISSLNHPNICALVEVGRADGTDYVVTEYVEGETLAQRLTRGPIELEEALKIAIQVADALDTAHRHGVAHRSLSPSNIMLTPGGVKLLDFGLAALNQPTGPALSVSSLPTRTATGPLAAIPTFIAPYIAPEQWDGFEADTRADIFAFGAILYEMVSGKPAFEGKTPALLIAAIGTLDPEPLSKVQPMAPRALEYLVKRCLAKDPKQRLQTARDLMSQLQWIADGGSQIGIPAPTAARRRKREQLVWVALATVTLLFLGMAPATYHYLNDSPEQEAVRFSVPQIPIPGQIPPLIVSPDGRWIAMARGAPNRGLNAVSTESIIPQMLIADGVPVQPFWSPDSRSIAFFEDGKLKKSEISGGPSQNICDAPGPIGGGTWNGEGVILFSSAGVIYRVTAAGGQPAVVTTLDQSKQETEHLAPYFLPDGHHYVFLSLSDQPSNSAIYVASLDSSERTRLFASQSKAVYAAPG